MKAILINSKDKTISEVEYNGDFRQIYSLIDCDCFTCVGIENNDTIFVDDEGLLNDPQYFFAYRGYDNPLAGNGLILGTDDEGGSVDCRHSLEEIKKNVVFLDLHHIELMIAMGAI